MVPLNLRIRAALTAASNSCPAPRLPAINHYLICTPTRPWARPLPAPQMGNLHGLLQFLARASGVVSGRLADVLSPARMVILGVQCGAGGGHGRSVVCVWHAQLLSAPQCRQMHDRPSQHDGRWRASLCPCQMLALPPLTRHGPDSPGVQACVRAVRHDARHAGHRSVPDVDHVRKGGRGEGGGWVSTLECVVGGSS